MDSIHQYHESLKGGASVVEKLQTYFDRIEKEDSEINAFISLNKQKAFESAEESDRRLKEGEAFRPLEGVPFAVKDMFCTAGLKTTAGSKMLENFVSPYDATVIKNLKAAGAIIVGKNNQDEFAMGSTNETSYFGACKNPWNKEYVAGGSSGGSAASVAARMAICSLGTDTGGSVRQPAHFCGTVGLKPTYGRISRYGVIAFASSLDQTGIFSLEVEDAFRSLEALAGKDPFDNTTANVEVPAWSQEGAQGKDLSGKTIGLVKEYMESKMSDEVRETLEQAIEALKERGCNFQEVSLPMVKHGVAAYYIIATSEAASNLARYDGVRYGYRSPEAQEGKLSLEEFYAVNRSEAFGAEVKRRILLGNFSLSSGYFDAYYKKACQVRRLLLESYQAQFKKIDAFLTPVASTTAFKLKENENDPLKKFLNDYFTVTVNLAGLPALTVPLVKTSSGLPCAVQLIANQFEESKLLQFGKALEEKFKFYKEVPFE